MAFNPSPKVAAARDIAKRFNKTQVIILMVDKQETLEYASYGATKQLCHGAKQLADRAFEAIYNDMWMKPY